MLLTGVTGSFCAAHYSPEGQLHGHSYQVTAWFENEGGRLDARILKSALERVLKRLDHAALPPRLTRGENIAEDVGATLEGCVEVEVSRPLEGFHARWRAE